MSFRAFLSPRWIVAHVFVAATVVAFLSLATWQLDRLEERRAQNRAIASRAALPELAAADLARAPTSAAELEYRNARIQGRFDGAREVVVRGRTRNDLSGNHILTPLVLSDGSAVLVDRGWVPLRLRRPGAREAAPPPHPVTVRGVVLLSERRGRFGPVDTRSGPVREIVRVDIDRLRPQMPYRLHPVWIQLRAQDPPQRKELPLPAEARSLDEGPHRSYAIQWVVFAALAIATYAALIRRAVRARESIAS